MGEPGAGSSSALSKRHPACLQLARVSCTLLKPPPASFAGCASTPHGDLQCHSRRRFLCSGHLRTITQRIGASVSDSTRLFPAMDPLSILAIAAAVVAFVDFGGKLLRSASKRLKDADPIDLATSLEDLTREAAHLDCLGRRIESTHKSSEASASRNPELDALLVELAREATVVSDDIEGLVATLQTTNKTPRQKKPPRKAAKDGSGETEKIQKAQQRLSMIKDSMMSTVLTCLWYVPTGSFVR